MNVEANLTCHILPKKTVLLAGNWRSPSNRHKMIRLDLNENTAEPALDGIDLPVQWINTYPDESLATSAVAELFELDRNQILLTNGSDEALQVIANTFVEPGLDSAVVSLPCFAPIRLLWLGTFRHSHLLFCLYTRWKISHLFFGTQFIGAILAEKICKQSRIAKRKMNG